MDDLLYREEILERYYDAPRRGRLEAPDRSAELDNPLCGDRIRLELALGTGGRIVAARFDGDGCVISQVAASFLAEHLEGMPVDEARRLPADKVIGLLGISLSPARVKCGILAWRALQHALDVTADSATNGSGIDLSISTG